MTKKKKNPHRNCTHFAKAINPKGDILMSQSQYIINVSCYELEPFRDVLTFEVLPIGRFSLLFKATYIGFNFY